MDLADRLTVPRCFIFTIAGEGRIRAGFGRQIRCRGGAAWILGFWRGVASLF
jgi:hypothetical protein